MSLGLILGLRVAGADDVVQVREDFGRDPG